ncbi:MAG: hypothetical protein AB7T32_14540 [Dehalococcoidia bacterium]
MAEVFAGFTCGFFLSLITAPVVAITLLRMRTNSALLARLLPENVNPVAVMVVLQLGLVFFWTGLGFILGLLLLAMDGLGESAAGLKNPPYTLLVLSIVLAFSGPLALLISSWWRQIIAGAVLTFLVFGALMPYMAEWSKFDDAPPEENRPAPPIFNARAGTLSSLMDT